MRHCLTIPLEEIHINAVRAQGAGGQNVNKVSSAAHLRFDIRASSLPQAVKERLLALGDQRITDEGVVVIKAQQHRSLEQNRQEALHRLQDLIHRASQSPKARKPTQRTRGSISRRLESKARRGELKAGRGKVIV
ncbi:MAG: aminoacyl-tRNA hydrolase [Betaproteobacteria bacterium]|nr:aminoacyl-tRNA hydrolase [Betaproteobacteria bacterium]